MCAPVSLPTSLFSPLLVFPLYLFVITLSLPSPPPHPLTVPHRTVPQASNSHLQWKNPTRAKCKPDMVDCPLVTLTAPLTHFFDVRWFHGKVSRSAAETRLKSVAVDCFLIRESENRVGEFALSVKHQGAVKHFRIDTKRGSGRRRFELFGAQHSFPSLTCLVGYYQEHSISSAGEVLQMPCPLEVSRC